MLFQSSQLLPGSLINGAGVSSSLYPEDSIIEPLVINTKSFSVSSIDLSLPLLSSATIF